MNDNSLKIDCEMWGQLAKVKVTEKVAYHENQGFTVRAGSTLLVGRPLQAASSWFAQLSGAQADAESVTKKISALLDKTAKDVSSYIDGIRIDDQEGAVAVREVLVRLRDILILSHDVGISNLLKTYDAESQGSLPAAGVSSSFGGWFKAGFSVAKDHIGSGDGKYVQAVKTLEAVRNQLQKDCIEKINKHVGVIDERFSLPLDIGSSASLSAVQQGGDDALRDYLKSFCVGVTVEQAKQYAEAGKSFLKSLREWNLDKQEEVLPLIGLIKSDMSEPPQYYKEMKAENMAALVWYLMVRAVREKKQGFSEGTFDIDDPEQKIYKYFTYGIDPDEEMLGARVYERASSHYEGRSAPLQKAIDIREDTSTILLPALKGTVLFGQLISKSGDTRLFIKPENFGTDNTWDLVAHAYDYAATRPARFGIVEESAEAYQKEHLPSEDKQMFRGVIEEIRKNVLLCEKLKVYFSPQSRAEGDEGLRAWKNWGWEQLFGFSKAIEVQVEQYGAAAIFEFICVVKSELPADGVSEELKGRINNLIIYLKDKYGEEVAYRKGNEVRFDDVNREYIGFT